MSKLKMPDFATEAEEAAWWFDNQDEIAVEAFAEIGKELIVLDSADAALGKAKAAACGMSYEQYMRNLVHCALQEQRAA
jgi:predicted DNA binding CopG/RHH family protein